MESNISDEIKRLEKQVIANSLQLNSLQPIAIDSEKESAILFSEKGSFRSQASRPNPPAMFAIFDDDSVDTKLTAMSADFIGGFYSTLFPVAASCGIPINEAVEGQRVGFTTKLLTRNGRACIDLKEKYGWELLCHTMTARYGITYKVATIAEANNFPDHPVAGLSETSNSSRMIHVVADGKDYVWSTSNTWVPVSAGYTRPFLCDFYTGKFISENPNYSKVYQFKYFKDVAKEMGFGEIDNFVIVEVTHSKTYTNYLKNIYRTVFGGAVGFNAGVGERIIPPLCSAIRRYRLDIAGTETNPDNASKPAELAEWKKQVDAAIKEGAFIPFYMHAYRPSWHNYKQGQLVSEGGTYPDSWVFPVQIPDVDSDPDVYLKPAPETGLADWKDWHPCPGTRLHDLWELIKYVQSKGHNFYTSNDIINVFGNIVEAGNYSAGQVNGRGADFDAAETNHYIIGVNGATNFLSK